MMRDRRLLARVWFGVAAALLAGAASAGPVQVPFAGLPTVTLDFNVGGQSPSWSLVSQDATNAYYSWQNYGLHLWLEQNAGQSIVHFSLTPPNGQSLSVSSYTAKVTRPTAGLHAVLVPNQRRIAQELSYPSTPGQYTPLYHNLIPGSFSEGAPANAEAPFILLTTSTGDNGLAAGWAVASVATSLSGAAEGGNYAITLHRQNDVPFTGTELHDALIVNTSASFWFDVERLYAQTFDAYNGRTHSVPPEWTSEPVFCTWYCYLDNINQQQVLDIAWKCKELGFGTILIDAGWDCYPNGGYANFETGILGDFIAMPDRFPNLPAAVAQMHAWGLKVELWSAPFWQGKRSQVYQTKTGTWHVQTAAGENYSLCPRYVGTAQHLYDTFRWVAQTYGIDGMWLDSADSIPGSCIASHQHLDQTMGSAFVDCMAAVHDGLRSVNPLAITEARVMHGNLNSKIALDIVQPSDAPHSFEPLRIAGIHLRPWAYDIVVKNDPMIWAEDADVATVGKFLATCVCSGVPDLSVDFLTAPDWQCQMTKTWFSFYQQHKETLLGGQFKLFGADYTSPDMALIATKEAVVYLRNAATTQAVLPTTLADIILLNCTTQNVVDLRIPVAEGRYTAQSYNPDWTPYGTPTAHEAVDHIDVNQVVPQGGAAIVSFVPQTLQVRPAGTITIDGSAADWALSDFTTLIRGGECGTGDIALVGYDGGELHYGGYLTSESLPTSAADHTARVYSRHDRNHLYLLVRCDDDDIRCPNPASSNSANDCVQFQIDPSHNHGSSALSGSGSDAVLVIDASNQKNVYYCEAGYASQVLGGVESAVSTDATGWWLEVMIAKAALDPDLPRDGTFGLDLCFGDNDGNDPAQSTVYSWSDRSSGPAFPSFVPDNWGHALIPDVTPPAPVTGFVATADDGKVTLSWTNPTDADYAATTVVYKNTSYPLSPTDGTVAVDLGGSPGESMDYLHLNLTNGTKYYYSAFARDASLNYARPAMASATPATVTHAVISASPFNSSADGWTISTWKAGSYALGTMAWNGSVGNPGGGMRCTGSGATDNTDTCTREGGAITKTISTVGYANIRVAYDLRVNSLGGNYTGGGAGGCSDDHNMIDEQLTVSYSTNGGLSWAEMDWLTRSSLLSYTSYGTRTIDLSGVSAVNSNPNFTLRFRWQLNTASDTADLDNITVMGKSTAGPVSIQQAKALPDGQSRSLQAKVVTGVFGDCFYVQEPDRVSGIRVVPTAAAAPGQGADITGTVRGQGAERYIDTAGGYVDIFSPGPAVLLPLGIGSLDLGGTALNGYTPGVIGGIGPNNIGLLVRVWGRVTQRDTLGLGYFYIDDGSRILDGTETDGEDNVGIRVKADPTPYPPGSYVVVTGIGCFADGLTRQVRPTADGIQTVGP